MIEKFEEGDKVVFDIGDGIERKGTIRGVTTTPKPIIGSTWIVELEEKIPSHPFSCIGVFESMMV